MKRKRFSTGVFMIILLFAWTMVPLFAGGGQEEAAVKDDGNLWNDFAGETLTDVGSGFYLYKRTGALYSGV